VTNDDLEELKGFLLEHIEDLDELEVLLWFRRRQPESWVSGAEIAAAHPFPAEATLDLLERLAARGLLEREAGAPPRYRCDPPDVSLRTLLDRMLAAYEANPLRFFQLMNANALERVRTAAIRAFAECFRMGGPKSNG
jgi:hypothetical protein